MMGGMKPTQSSSRCQVSKGGACAVVAIPQQQQMLLKCRSTTQEMLSASENGVVVTFSSNVDSSPKASLSSAERRKQLLRADTGGDESCTLKTFVSVGASIESDTLFVLSKLSDEHSSQRLQPSGRLPARSHSFSERETRKRLHYKEKLRTLAERLTSNSVVDWPKRENEGQVDARSVDTQDDDDIETKFGRVCGSLRKKLLACTMNMCVHDAIIDPEGLIISVTRKNLNCAGDEDSAANDGFLSEVSSLTDETHHRYQARYRYRYY
jgi:hypothetical protein